MTKSKTQKIEVDGKTIIKCGKVEITDAGEPFTTKVKIDGEDITESLGNIQSFKYEVMTIKNKKSCAEPGKSKLTIEYFPRHYMVKK